MCASGCSPHFIFRVERRSPSIKHQKEIDLQSFFSGKTLLEVCFTNWHITASREICDDKLTILAYWYSPCGRSSREQEQFEQVEARPQGLEKLFCEIWSVPFSPSLDDFSGRYPSAWFLEKLENAYIEMKTTPPNTPQRVLEGMRHFVSNISTYRSFSSRLQRARAGDRSEPKRFRSGCRNSEATDRKNSY